LVGEEDLAVVVAEDLNPQVLEGFGSPSSLENHLSFSANHLSSLKSHPFSLESHLFSDVVVSSARQY
jgi:hypothetical protein